MRATVERSTASCQASYAGRLPLKGLSPRRLDKSTAADRARIKELERELHRKEKALAEAAALLVLRKKLEALHWFEDDAPTDRSERSSSPRSTKR